MTPTVKQVKRELYRLLYELEKYDERKKCPLTIDDNNGGYYTDSFSMFHLTEQENGEIEITNI